MSIYDDRVRSSQATTSPDDFLRLAEAVDNVAAFARVLTNLLNRLMVVETVADRLAYLETVNLMIRKADFEAAQVWLDEEVF